MLSDKMMLSVATVGYLNVFGSYKAVSHSNAHIVGTMLEHVSNTCTSAAQPWSEFAAHVLEQAQACDDSGVLITWRPLRCLDVAILPVSSEGQQTMLALPLHGMQTTVEVFMSHECLRADSDGVFFCAHFTVDMIDGASYPVLLVYDSFAVDAKGAVRVEDAAVRRARVQRTCEEWEARQVWCLILVRLGCLYRCVVRACRAARATSIRAM